MTSQPPAGWFPDPEMPEQLRYWDGTQWTEHRAPRPAEQPTPVPGTAPWNGPTTQPTGAQTTVAKGRGNWWKWTLGIVAALVVIGALVPDEEPPASASSVVTTDADDDSLDEAADTEPVEAEEPPAETKTPKPKPVSPYGKQPRDQRRFVAAATKAQRAAENADSDLQTGAALSTRNKSICQSIGSGHVRSWVGEVSELDANGDGKGILGIEIADDVHVSTWNNFLSDAVDETLIEPGPLFDQVIQLEEGQLVRFSGQFVEELGGDPCVNDSRLTLYGKVTDPQFIFRFSEVRPVR